MGSNRGRTGPRWEAARAECLRQANELGDVICAWCHEPIDMSLSGRHRMGPTADHIHEMQQGGHLLGALAPMHKGCNSTKGNLTRQGKLGPRTVRSRDW